ncbi:hypothetical protein [Oceanobacillus alkalisoli]|uniref:hypothetical protein n=1 Tax=Oceanobacillus alkalisoli TaxID=2925113 RepID=UPI001EF06A55|nr:hypothetical protein [Oceanobacillus alkalisoli]MCF3942780.1 hypothetical protein [Oceanobacillus alkalisoli]MCG5102751.1 hypothetical protein [Oceanobacillus alkalisoli]
MKQTYEKVIQLELLTLGLSVVLGFIALFQSSIFLVIFSFYLLGISLICDAYSHQYTSSRMLQGKKQLIRAAVILLLASALFLL